MKLNFNMKGIKDKKGIELRFLVISIIIFSGIFGFLTLAFHDAASCDNGYCNANVTDAELEERYSSLENQTALVTTIKDTTEGSGGLGLLNVLGTVFTATIGVMKAVLASLAIIPNLIGGFAEDFGIPTAVVNLFFVLTGLILTVLVVFAILNSIRR